MTNLMLVESMNSMPAGSPLTWVKKELSGTSTEGMTSKNRV